MKQLLSLLAFVFFLAACSTNKPLAIPPNEKFEAKKITAAEASDYRKNYENQPSYKVNFRKGMMIPVSVIDSIRSGRQLEAIAVYFGKHPDFSSPVFIVYGSKSITNATEEASEEVYMIYYPCPTNCGQ